MKNNPRGRRVITPDDLGVICRDIRNINKMSQSEVANKAGMRQGTVSDFERDAGSSKVETMFKLLASLGFDIRIVPKAQIKGQVERDDW